MNRLRWLVLAIAIAALWPCATAASGPGRTKPGPVTIRGVATHVTPRGFVLATTHGGSYTVTLVGATQIVEKGRSGRLTLHEGDHVGVSGFVTGRGIRALKVRIYPTKPKPYDIRGTVVSVAAGRVVVSAGGSRETVAVTASTAISLGRTPAAESQIHSGDRVRLRVVAANGTLTALSVYIYVSRTAAKHVTVHGTVSSVSSGRVTVASGTAHISISITSQTFVRRGTNQVAPSAIHVGQVVTVHACCQGGQLLATSVRIDVSRVTQHTYDVRGQVTGISGGRLTVSIAGRATTVRLTASTSVQIGATVGHARDIRIGDEITARVYRAGSTVVAERVRILAASRQTRNVRGIVVAVGHGTVAVMTRGKRYVAVVAVNVPVTLNGKRVSLGSVHAGDHITLEILGTATPGRALALTLTRPPPKQITVRGVVVGVATGTLVIAGNGGRRYVVRSAPGVRALLKGQPAPPSALFPGITARARGTISGNTLLATSLTISVKSRSVHGRIAKSGHGYLDIQTSLSATVRVDLIPGTFAFDGKKHLVPAALPVGVELKVTGWVESVSRIRATALTVEHPTLSVAGTVISAPGGLIVTTSSGAHFFLRIAGSSQIVASRLHLSLKPGDVPAGAHVYVDGTLDASGRLVVTTMTVRLISVTLRGMLSSTAGGWDVIAASGTLHLRLQSDTPVVQGSHALTLADVVSGDLVTVYGYTLAQSNVLVRKLDVHRKLTGFEGTVGAISSEGFILQSADGQHRVITASSTILSGVAAALATGQTVHVTGYVRGDGVILATRVRIVKSA